MIMTANLEDKVTFLKIHPVSQNGVSKVNFNRNARCAWLSDRKSLTGENQFTIWRVINTWSTDYPKTLPYLTKESA